MKECQNSSLQYQRELFRGLGGFSISYRAESLRGCGAVPVLIAVQRQAVRDQSTMKMSYSLALRAERKSSSIQLRFVSIAHRQSLPQAALRTQCLIRSHEYGVNANSTTVRGQVFFLGVPAPDLPALQSTSSWPLPSRETVHSDCEKTGNTVTQYLIAQEPEQRSHTPTQPPPSRRGGGIYTQLNLKYGNVVLDCGRPTSGDRHAREPVPGFGRNFRFGARSSFLVFQRLIYLHCNPLHRGPLLSRGTGYSDAKEAANTVTQYLIPAS